MTTIVIEKNTRSKLRSVGRKEQTYDDIINELLEKSGEYAVDSEKSTTQERL